MLPGPVSCHARIVDWSAIVVLGSLCLLACLRLVSPDDLGSASRVRRWMLFTQDCIDRLVVILCEGCRTSRTREKYCLGMGFPDAGSWLPGF